MQQELFEKRKLLPLILFHVFNTSNCLNWSCPRTFHFPRKQQWLQNWKVKHSNSISRKILVPFLSLCIRSRLALIPTCSCEGLYINTFSGDHVFWILAWIRNIYLCSLSFLCSILSCLTFAIQFVRIPRDLVMPIVNTLTQGIFYMTWVMGFECLITKQFNSRLFNCDIAMSKTFEYRPVKNRTMRYATICVLSGNVAFGQHFIPHVDTCQLAMKSLLTIKASANRVLLFSKHQSAASLKCIVLSGIICYLSGKLTIFIKFRYSLSVFPGETHVLPGIIVEICRGKTKKKQIKTNKNKNKKQNKTKKQKKKQY